MYDFVTGRSRERPHAQEMGGRYNGYHGNTYDTRAQRVALALYMTTVIRAGCWRGRVRVCEWVCVTGVAAYWYSHLQHNARSPWVHPPPHRHAHTHTDTNRISRALARSDFLCLMSVAAQALNHYECAQHRTLHANDRSRASAKRFLLFPTCRGMHMCICMDTRTMYIHLDTYVCAHISVDV